MYFMITTQHPKSGKGYFNGFRNGNPYFQSDLDRFVKRYAVLRNANEQLSRILAHSPDKNGEDTKVETVFTIEEKEVTAFEDI